jgi:hypothetical protein
MRIPSQTIYEQSRWPVFPSVKVQVGRIQNGAFTMLDLSLTARKPMRLQIVAPTDANKADGANHMLGDQGTQQPSRDGTSRSLSENAGWINGPSGVSSLSDERTLVGVANKVSPWFMVQRSDGDTSDRFTRQTHASPRPCQRKSFVLWILESESAGAPSDH